MEKKNKYYVVRDKALPEVLQKVVEVKRLLEADKTLTVQEAAEQVGLAAVPSINIRMIFFRFPTTREERP